VLARLARSGRWVTVAQPSAPPLALPLRAVSLAAKECRNRYFHEAASNGVESR
jgi:hypothetical protein